MKKFFQNAKTKASLVVAGVVGGASNSFAAVTWDTANNKFTGSLEMGAYYSGVEIAIGVVAIVIATGLAFAAIRKAR